MHSEERAEMRTLQMITEGASLTDIVNHICSSVDLQISPSITNADGPGWEKAMADRRSEGTRHWARAITPLDVQSKLLVILHRA